MKISLKQYASSLYQALLETNKADLVAKNFLQILQSKKDLKYLDKILQELDYVRAEVEDVKIVQITIARDDKKIISSVKKLLGRKIEPEFRVDKKIIAGVKIEIQDKLIDASVKSQIQSLKV
ncbi:hypothetical protein CL633_03985 [bacterium]|nr:hypothetical protein [bacterium]|tara:strand:+ start:5908 stop:6273 length:366 start_codon:yes stop_codon:yes gene_type:complete